MLFRILQGIVAFFAIGCTLHLELVKHTTQRIHIHAVKHLQLVKPDRFIFQHFNFLIERPNRLLCGLRLLRYRRSVNMGLLVFIGQ